MSDMKRRDLITLPGVPGTEIAFDRFVLLHKDGERACYTAT